MFGRATNLALSKLPGAAAFIIQCGCIAHCTLEFVGDFVICTGPSMEPTIGSHNIIITEHISPLFHYINKGDIIVARSPCNPQQYICKRVAGLPGDYIQSRFGFCTKVPKGHVWLEGDNKGNSTDSRLYGAVPQALIRGKAICKVWPLSSIAMLNREPPRSKC